MIDLTRDDLHHPFATKEYIILVHGQEHVSVKTWNEGAKVDAKLDLHIQVKIILHYSGPYQKFSRSTESMHQSQHDSKDPNSE